MGFLKRLSIAAALLALPSLVVAATTRYIESRDTLQSGTTFYVSSGTVNALNVPTSFKFGTTAAAATLSGSITDQSTRTASGTQNIGGTINVTSSSVTFTGASTTTFNGPIGFGGVFPSSGSYPVSQGAGLPPKWTSLGRIVQIQNYTFSTSSSTTATTFVLSQITGTITPTSTTSKILIMASLSVANTSASGNQESYFTVERNASNLGGTNGMIGVAGTGAIQIEAGAGLFYLDSPASTSSLTYAIYMRGATSNATSSIGSGSQTQSLILVEIQQ